jgi:hypothetical protein
MSETRPLSPPVPVVALMAWLVPGMGYWLLGQRSRALTVGITILVLFVGGIFIGGIRVVELPQGPEVTADGRTVPVGDQSLLAGIKEKPWFVPQVLTGPVSIVCGMVSSSLSHPSAAGLGLPRSHARVNDIGTLYTAIAGMLNLLAIIDAAYRVNHRGKDE